MQESIWFRALTEPQRAALLVSDPLPGKAEIVIVGAGLIGLSTAYYLLESGCRDIVVVDRSEILGEASGANAGGLWFAQQSPELGPVAALARRGSELYDELAERFSFEMRRCGLIELIFDESKVREARERLRLVIDAGFRAEFLSGDDARALEPALGVTPAAALYYPDEGNVHPVQFGLCLVENLRARGVRICPNTAVNRVGRSIDTDRGPLQAETVIIACGAWTPLVTQILGWSPPIRPIRGVLLSVEPVAPLLRQTLIGGDYYYWQLADGHVAGGGSVEDVGFERGVKPAIRDHIRHEMNRLLPALAKRETVCSWSGFRPYCEDLRPVIGRVPGQDHTFVAAGHFKKGVMMAPVTGRILADLVVAGGGELDLSPLDPARFPRREAA